MQARCALILACSASILLPACQTERRVVAVRGGLTGLANLPGGRSNLPQDEKMAQAGPPRDTWAKVIPQDAPGNPVEGRPLRRQLDDGTTVLLSRSPRELIQHLFETLRDQEYELLETQVLSQRTRQSYLAAGKKPQDAVQWLVRNQVDIEKLISVMPAGEQTPGVMMTSLGNNAFRLSLDSSEILQLRYRTMDLVVEQGKFRLLMVR